MIDIQLKYNLVHKWKTENGISVIGSAFLHTELLKTDAILEYFRKTTDKISFTDKLKKLSGHFSIVIETDTTILIAVDTIRTFPLFVNQQKNEICIADTIVPIMPRKSWHDVEAENFKKIYCTLENNTLLKDWKQLQAGEYAVIDKQNHTVEIRTYYQHLIPIAIGSDSGLHASKTSDQKKILKEKEKNIIDKIIKYANNRTILIPLSGGYDSRYLLALLIENNYTNIECFTYGRKESYEVLIAKNVCEKLNIKWHFIEYTDELLQSYFTEKWNQYSDLNHHFSSLPHEQDFFALQYLRKNNLLPKDAVVMNGFCQDLHAGSIFERISNFDLQKFIYHKYLIKPNLSNYENSWNGYQQWFIKNRVSKFIINSVQVYEYFGLDFYLPFWNTDWINYWYSLNMEMRLNQQFYNDYLFNGILKKYKIDLKKPSHDSTNKFYTLKKISKAIFPTRFTKLLQTQNSKNISKDSNNTLFLYEEIYKRLKDKPVEKDFRINNIHANYLLEKLKENDQLY